MLLAAMYFRAGTWLKLEEAILRDTQLPHGAVAGVPQKTPECKNFLTKTFVFPDLDKNVQAQSFFGEDIQLFAASVDHHGCQNSYIAGSLLSLESLGE